MERSAANAWRLEIKLAKDLRSCDLDREIGVLSSRDRGGEAQRRCGDFNVLRTVCQVPNALSKPRNLRI